jgi:acetyl esterase
MTNHTTLTDPPPIDPGMLAFYDKLHDASPAEAVTWPLPRQREAWNEVCRAFAAPTPPGLVIEDLTAPRPDGGKVPFRLYRPIGGRDLPITLYFHGGGWVLGGIPTHDDMCAELAARSGTAVALVDYRLAPEHPHPAQFEDNLAVWSALRGPLGAARELDANRMVAAGDSAGGQMSASLALHLRDTGAPRLHGLVLIYPVLGVDLETESYLRNAEAPCLTRSEMIFFLESVLGPPGSPAWSDPTAVPMAAADVSRLPPTFLIPAGHDPLHDDAVLFEARLRAAGVPTRLRSEPALAHSFMRARHVSQPAADAFTAIVEAVAALGFHGRLPEPTP